MNSTVVYPERHHEKVQCLRCMEHKVVLDSAGYLHTFSVMLHEQDSVVHFHTVLVMGHTHSVVHYHIFLATERRQDSAADSFHCILVIGYT